MSDQAREIAYALIAAGPLAHDRDAFDAVVERLNAELVKAYRRISDLEAENDRLRYGKAAG